MRQPEPSALDRILAVSPIPIIGEKRAYKTILYDTLIREFSTPKLPQHEPEGIIPVKSRVMESTVIIRGAVYLVYLGGIYGVYESIKAISEFIR